MSKLTSRDAINLMLDYYGRFPAQDTAHIVVLLSKADVIGLVQYAYKQGQNTVPPAHNNLEHHVSLKEVEK